MPSAPVTQPPPVTEPPVTEPPATEVPAVPPPARPSAAGPAPPPRRFKYEGAIGPVIAVGPGDTSGLSTHFTPGIFIRWDRWVLTNESGFVTRRDEVEVTPGLSAELLRDEHWRANTGLRIDRGRQVSDTQAADGLQDVRATLRGRLTVTYDFGNGLAAVMNTSVDLLGHDGGVVVDLSVNKTFPIGLKTWWGVGVAISAADQRYMQSYFGTSPSEISGSAPYRPGAGLRDAGVGVSLRSEIGERWIGFVGAGYSVLLGPARDSPGITRTTGWGVNGGLAWRFWW